MSFAREVWTTLSRINCADWIEKKGQFTYLSWAWAWQILCDHYPNNSKSICEKIWPDGSMEVGCEIEIRSDDGEVLTRCETLAVMDHSNRAIKKPDAVAINKARKRCEAKCIALFGLALYLYRGEDLPLLPNNDDAMRRVTEELRKIKEKHFNEPDHPDEVWDHVTKDLVCSHDIEDRMKALDTLRNVVEMRGDEL